MPETTINSELEIIEDESYASIVVKCGLECHRCGTIVTSIDLIADYGPDQSLVYGWLRCPNCGETDFRWLKMKN